MSSLCFSAVSASALSVLALPAVLAANSPLPTPAQRAQEGFAKLPLAFERNAGQVHRDVQYIAQGPGYRVFLEPADIVLRMQKEIPAESASGRATSSSAAVRLQFINANRHSKFTRISPGRRTEATCRSLAGIRRPGRGQAMRM